MTLSILIWLSLMLRNQPRSSMESKSAPSENRLFVHILAQEQFDWQGKSVH